MAKIILLLAVIASSVFLLTQFITIYYFSDISSSLHKFIKNKFNYHTNLYNNIEIFIEKCESVKITCTLVQKDILLEFIALEKKHRETGKHEHKDCKNFCRKSFASFIIKYNEIHNKYDFFIESLSNEGFNVVQDKNLDQRDISLEQRKGTYLITNHVYLIRNNAFIHIVLSYPRMKHEWTFICNLQLVKNQIFYTELNKSPYCSHEKLFQTMETTTAIMDSIKISIPQYLATFLKDIEANNFLSCDYNRARTFFSSYGYDSSQDSEIFRSKATNLLSIAIDVLNDLNVRFWLSSGTCLGWFRQCDFIPHSKDVDIGIWIKDYKKEIIPAFKNRGMSLKHIFGKVEDSFELSFTLDDLKLDIFFFYEDTNNMWNGGTQARTGKKFKYLFDKFTLCWASISKLTVRVPCETHRYILANYGEKWNVLVKAWDWKASPPNVRENGEWPKEEHGQVIQVF